MPKRKESHRLLVIWLCDTPIDIREVRLAIYLIVGKGFLEAVENHLVGCFGLPWGYLGVDMCCLMLYFWKNFDKSLPMNCGPLSATID
ncbi:hypothetical protein ACFX2C_006821 [Malus domestica]